jgi:predicted O-methyltransferase YrrM
VRYDDFVVLLARQRSGTNPLRSVLETHPDVFCFNEVFNLVDKDSPDDLLRESNFFTFLERYADGDVRRTFPDNHERLFVDYLEYLRCLAPARFKVIDLKYNATRILSGNWAAAVGTPYVLDLVKAHELRVLHLTRRNYLRYVLSTEKAWRTDRYSLNDGKGEYVDLTVKLDPEYVLEELEACRREDEVVGDALASHAGVLTRDYTEIFTAYGTASRGFLEDFALWLGVENAFQDEATFAKQSALPLAETLENFDEIARMLRGTDFEDVLDDEPAYRSMSPTSHRRPRPVSDWPAVVGGDPDAFVDGLCRSRPDWITGSLSDDDAHYLFRTAADAHTPVAVEIGTASGFSTAVLAHALGASHRAAGRDSDWQVVSYDIDPRLYFDRSKRVGDAARAMLPPHLLERIDFRAPATAIDLKRHHAPSSLEYLFIDANHHHPWPTLDLLATLDQLAPGAAVVLHDINLPLIHPQFAAWGVKYLFDALPLEKDTSPGTLPNIGRIRIPREKAALREQLVRILDEHEWEVEVPDHVRAAVERRDAAA